MMPAGVYFVGDPCIRSMEGFWEDLVFYNAPEKELPWPDENKEVNEHTSVVSFGGQKEIGYYALYPVNKKGFYFDNEGERYELHEFIGAFSLNLIFYYRYPNTSNQTILDDLNYYGRILTFPYPFKTCKKDKEVVLGHLTIDLSKRYVRSN